MSRYYEEIARIAALRGIRTEEKADCLYLEMDDSYLCEVMENGGVRYRKSDTDTPARSRMLHDIIGDVELAREYVSAMEAAPFLKASGLVEDKFKLLLDYGGYLLAGQDRGSHGFQFVTWEWNRTAVGTGNYWEGDYQGAKEDFAIRSSLVSRDRLFNEEQSMALYRLVRQCLESNPDIREKKLVDEIQRNLERSFPKLEGQYLVEGLAADPRTGYVLIESRRRTSYATGLYDEASGTYLSEARPEEFPNAEPFESPYDGLAKLCRKKIHLRDYEQVWDYPLVLEVLSDAESLAGRLEWNYGANTGFLVEGLAFVKAVSESDKWLMCKRENGDWKALDHVSLYHLLKQNGEKFFAAWLAAVRDCPVGGYPEQFTAPESTGPSQSGFIYSMDQ